MPLFEIEGLKEKRKKIPDKDLIKKTKKIVNEGDKKEKSPRPKKSMTLIDRIYEIQQLVEEKLGHLKNEYIIIQTEEELNNYISTANTNDIISIDTETTGFNPIYDKIVGLCLFTPKMKAAYVPINHIDVSTGVRCPNQLTEKQVYNSLKNLLAKIIMFNAVFDLRVIKNQIGIELTCYWDCYVASQLMNENEVKSGLKPLHEKYVLRGESKEFSFDDLFKGITFDYIPIQTAYLYASKDAIITFELYEFQKKHLSPTGKNGMDKVYEVFMNIEMPCIKAICEMEDTGFKLDTEYINEILPKYKDLQQEKLQICYNEINKYEKEITEYKRLCEEKGEKCKLDDPINIASPTQLAILFYDIMKIGVIDKDSPRGTGEPILEKMNTPFSKALLDYRGATKLITTYLEKMPKELLPDGKIHCKLNSVGTVTGRFCIAKGTKITTVGGYKNIEDIEPGDLIYCFDDFGNLKISTVKNKWLTGQSRDCVKVRWRSAGTKEQGWLICTPEHKIRKVTGEWVEAQYLSKLDRLAHLKRSEMSMDNRPTFYYWGAKQEKEQSVIKREYFNCTDPNFVIHHIDGIKNNNTINNLQVMSKSEHVSLHSKILYKEGKLNTQEFCKPEYKEKARVTFKKNYIQRCIERKQELLDKIQEYQGRLSKIPGDFNTFKNQCICAGIDLHEECKKYNPRYYKEVISEKDLMQKYHEFGCNINKTRKYFHISYDKFYSYCKEYGISLNHQVLSVEPCGQYDVYDLEVENYHNFIANELCVHNSCNSPNLQNIPSKNKEIRKMFVADDGYVLMSADFSQQEPKVMAQLSNDEIMLEAFRQGKDLYAQIAAVSFHRTYEDCLEFYLDENGNKTEVVNKEGKKYRTQAKSILLGILYGRGEKSVAEQLGCSTEGARNIKESVFKGFPAIKEFEEGNVKMAQQLGYVTTLWGRKRRLPNIKLPEYSFEWIDETKTDKVPDYLIKKYWDKLHKCKYAKEKTEVKNMAQKEGIKVIDNGGKIAEAKRQATNARIQGSAADMTKLAMIAIANNKEFKELGARLIIPIHDEILIECPIENARKVKKLFAELMETCAVDKLHIPIKCDVETSFKWAGDPIEV